MTGQPAGVVELDRAVASIRVGHRHRRDLGDLGELTDSIRQLGMLQPITITPDGTLICGARRLAAAKDLGLRHINVWVRSSVSDPLQRLLAEQHENTLRKPYSPREAAALYRELKALIAEDNRRRQQATRFGADQTIPPGPANFAAPGDQTIPPRPANFAAPGDRTSRAQAAQLITGRKAYTTLERIGELEALATDPQAAPPLRDLASQQLDGIESDGKVYGRYRRVQDARADTTPQPSTRAAVVGRGGERRRRGVRSFLLTWESMHGWADAYDPTDIGPALTDQQWVAFTDTVHATVAFADAARTARPTT